MKTTSSKLYSFTLIGRFSSVDMMSFVEVWMFGPIALTDLYYSMRSWAIRESHSNHRSPPSLDTNCAFNKQKLKNTLLTYLEIKSGSNRAKSPRNRGRKCDKWKVETGKKSSNKNANKYVPVANRRKRKYTHKERENLLG